jgi:F-type H+-transporting ATPase subunit c
MQQVSIEVLSTIYAYTAIGVCFVLAAAGVGSAIGWAMICSRTMEGITRQPELNAMLTQKTFIFGGLMESFPFIILAMSMWFIFANPFAGALEVAAKSLG